MMTSLCFRSFARSVIQHSGVFFALTVAQTVQTAVKCEKATFVYNLMHVLQRSSFTVVAKSTVLPGRCTVFMSSPGYSKEICFLWFIAKKRHSWPQKRRFCGFHSHFLLDSSFQVAARKDCLSGEGNRARAGAAMTWELHSIPVAPIVQDWHSANRRQEQATRPCSDLAKPYLRMLQGDQVSPERSSQKQLPIVCFLLGCGLHWTR